MTIATGIEIERRMIVARELRASAAGEAPRISGYAALFNTLSQDLGGFRERIAPGAFTKSLAEDDVRALRNHNPDYVLGRNRANTLSLAEDEAGLRFEVTPPDAQWANDLLVSIRRGDVDQMSFGFEIRSTDGHSWEQVDNQIIRTLLDVKLWEISPVTFPAYPQTSAQVRSMVTQLQTTGNTGQGLGGAGDRGQKRQAPLTVLRARVDLALKV